MIGKIINHLFTRKITIAKWQLNFVVLLAFTAGSVFGLYFLATGVLLPRIFAATSWTQTDWSSGVGASTTNQYSAGSNVEVASISGQITLAQTSNWYNSSWSYRKKITFDNTTATLGVTSEALTNFPVLVKLTSSNFDFTKAQSAGQDLRFSDSDGTTLLSYEIESWDNVGQTAYVWVKVPSVDINSNTDNIYMYYGNSGATDAQSATNVWDSNFLGVWHMKESSGVNIADSKGVNNGIKASSSQPAPNSSGQIAGAQTYTQGSSRIGTSVNTALGDFTVEVWYKDDGVATGYERLADKSYTGCFWFGRNSSTSNSWGGGVMEASNPYGVFVTLTDGQWHQISSVRSGATHYIYGDGGSVQNSNTVSAAACSTVNFGIGGYGDGSNQSQWFGGNIDEVRLSSSARSKAWLAASYKSGTDNFNTFAAQEPEYVSSGTITSNIFDTGAGEAWGNLTYTATTPTNTTASVKVRAGNSADLSDATAFASCSAVASGADLTGGCTPDNKRYVQYQVALSTTDPTATSTFSDITINYSAYDTTAPPTNASAIAMATASSGGRTIASNGWNNATNPYFSWTAGADDGGGSGLLGYCLYLGTDSAGDPATSKGSLGTTPVSIPSTSTCQFIVSSTSIDLSTSGYIGTDLVSGSTYYLNIVAIDNAGNTYGGGSATFHFRHDSTVPTNLAYLTVPSQNFSNVADMNFSWPTSGGSASSDSDAGVLGWQYQINSSSGTWQGTTHNPTLNLDYIPATASAYTLIPARDSSSVSVGNNVIYFRTVDSAGNTSSSSTYRTGNLTYGGAAPTFTTSCSSTTGVTVDPTTATSNSYSLSWETASPSAGQSVTHYYYMVNTSPPSTLSTITSNTSTYVDKGTSTSVSTGALTGSIRGSNTIYVVVADDADNYSSSNCLKGTYTLNSTNPDPPTNVTVSDASVKSGSLWRASLAWGAPDYKGTGSLTYTIDRSTNNSSWTNVATSSGTAYVDTVSTSSLFYWRVGSYDTSSQSKADPSYATSVSLTPTGKYTSAPDLASGPTVSSITTKKAKITWSTSRDSDSKVAYGTSTGSYFTEEPSNSTQTTDHTINLTNLTPGTTYYFKAKWTDGDGNTGTSDEKVFSTSAAPTVKDVSASSIGLDSAIINFTSVGASSVKIYYGKSTSFGSLKTTDTSTSETAYTTQLSDLDDGTKYYYKINTVDSDGNEYEGTVLDFITLPKPKISTVRIQEVTGTAQPTVLITWTTNTEISSIATYYPSGKSNQSHDQVNVALVKGEHKMLISSLFPQTFYNLVIKGVDKAGNEAVSDVQTFTTATDTRPPAISNLHVEGGNTNPGDSNQNSTTQLIVSWDTDEPATSQVQFGEGTGSTYSSQTQEDSSLTSNHVVVISGLTPSKVYHLQALSKDKATNQGKSMDTVTITPKATDNALNLIITNLQSVFGFLGGK